MKVTFVAIEKNGDTSKWVLDEGQIGVSTSIQDPKTGLTLTNIKMEEAVAEDIIVCPFCGTEIKWWQDEDGDIMTGHIDNDCILHDLQWSFHSLDEAKSKWNKRATTSL